MQAGVRRRVGAVWAAHATGAWESERLLPPEVVRQVIRGDSVAAAIPWLASGRQGIAPLPAPPTPAELRTRGACRDGRVDMFGEDVAAAKEVCAGCPVRDAICRPYATRFEAWGVWAGTTPEERGWNGTTGCKPGPGRPGFARSPEAVTFRERYSAYRGDASALGMRHDLAADANAAGHLVRRVLSLPPANIGTESKAS